MPNDHGRPDETAVLREITDAMLLAGVSAYTTWKQRRRRDMALSNADLVRMVYVSMRRASPLPSSTNVIHIGAKR